MAETRVRPIKEAESLMMSPQEVAMHLSISTDTVDRLIQKRQLKCKKVGGQKRIYRDSFKKYLGIA